MSDQRRSRRGAWAQRSIAAWRFAAPCAVVAALVGCGPQSSTERAAVPSEDQFAAVSSALSNRCGSLDCHGSETRNLRLYGEFGLRLGADVPGGEPATELEHHANYLSVISLEPELLAELAALSADQVPGAAQRLTLVRKARETEHHKGGAVFPKGSDGDVCVVSWLGGEVASERCDAAAALPLRP